MAEAYRVMITPSGKQAQIPFSRVQEAVDDGLEFAEQMKIPDSGNLTWVPRSRIEEAKTDGLTMFESDLPAHESPYEIKQGQDAYAKSKEDRGILGKAKDDFKENFLSGGASDIRNMAMAGLIGVGATPGGVSSVINGTSKLIGSPMGQFMAEQAAKAGPIVIDVAKKTPGVIGDATASTGKFIGNTTVKYGKKALEGAAFLGGGSYIVDSIYKMFNEGKSLTDSFKGN